LKKIPRHKKSSDHEILEILQNVESASESSDDFEEWNNISTDSANVSNSSDEGEFSLPQKKMRPSERERKVGKFTPKIQQFTVTQSGISNNLPNVYLETPLDFFEHFFASSLVEDIVRQTNIYKNPDNSSVAPKTASWADKDVREMYIFFATTMLMSHTKKNRIKDF